MPQERHMLLSSDVIDARDIMLPLLEVRLALLLPMDQESNEACTSHH